MLFQVPTRVVSNYFKSLLPRQNIKFKMPAVCDLILSSMENIVLWCSLLLTFLGDPEMKKYINPNRHVMSVVNLYRSIQTLSLEANLEKKNTKNETHLKGTPKCWCSSQSLSPPELFSDFQNLLKADLPADHSVKMPKLSLAHRTWDPSLPGLKDPHLLGVQGEALEYYHIRHKAFLFLCCWKLGPPGASYGTK